MSDSPSMSRREVLRAAGTGLAVAGFHGWKSLAAIADQSSQPATILLRSGWQTANIGDIAHTPGLLRLLTQYQPATQVILWKGRALDRGVDSLLRNAFPGIQIAESSDGPTLKEAFEKADILLHGSGPSIGVRQLDQWRKAVDKPYGTYGNTFGGPIDAQAKDVLSGAAFIYTRETQSRDRLREAEVSTPVLEFAPDATFSFDLTDETAAKAFLSQNGLVEDQFICVIPRLRKTPYYKIYPNDRSWTPQRIREVDALNEKWAEIDHAKAREAMIRWVRETGHKVLVCPEMTYQLDIMDELLINPLPDDVKPHVVKRGTYWMPDEAASVYRRARAVLSCECHAPIIAFAQGTPAFYLRQPEDTIKGQMWYDIGVPQWVFEIEESTGQQIADRLMSVHHDYKAALAYLADAMDVVRRRQEASMEIVRATVAATRGSKS